MSKSYFYRQIWEKHNGPIPKDSDGRSYEIHHIDGNRDNNNISNLMCVSAREHFSIHHKQGDYGACVLIARRLALTGDQISDLQRGVKRPGVGGRKPGFTHPGKGKPRTDGFVYKEEYAQKSRESSNKRAKMTMEMAEDLRTKYGQRVEIPGFQINKVMKNGRKMSYLRAFSVHYGKQLGFTPNYITRVIQGKARC
ncbi:MAG: HNH endonuclease [Candidatus Thiodiazotropha taylori]|uniref:HNH endonuclease n=1 Tax=Candidatus Thiodiazotropha taylori TaxID=2792791 RepID=A0A9E4KA75_9GAMM|nr:HNH endonuclease [Candidatus Thiodiazotropha taylori]MCW4255035.1 HNH endonuclease [Candidatus Thiodiazotropha taylori]